MTLATLFCAKLAMAADATGLHVEGPDPGAFLTVPLLGRERGTVASGVVFSWVGQSAVARTSDGDRHVLLAGVGIADIGASWAPVRGLRLEVDIPVIAFAERAETSGGRLGDVAFAATFATVSTPGMQLGPRASVSLPIAPYGPLTTDGGVSAAAGVVAAIELTPARLGAELGVRWRPDSGLGDAAWVEGVELGGWSLPWGFAGIVKVVGPVSVGAELGGEFMLGDADSAIVPHGAELLGNVRVRLGSVEFLAGGGGGLTAAFGVPDGRVTVGVRAAADTNQKLRRDMDGDGVANGYDLCPADTEDPDGFEDADGCVDPDNDRDEVADAADRCPDDPEDRDGYFDADGCPELDNDGDGRADADDRCPNASGLPSDAGCPTEAPHVVVEEGQIRFGHEVFFESGLAVLRSEALPVLGEVASAILGDPAIRLVQVAGHTDDVGDADANNSLSLARAAAVRDFLVEGCGLDPSRIEARGFGESMPISENETEEGRATNRRVVFVVALRR